MDVLEKGESQYDDNERAHPGKIDNSDIILENNKFFLKTNNKNEEWTNVQLKPKLKENEDFILVDETVWKNLQNVYGVNKDQTILRKGIMINNETEECIVETYLKPILIFPIPNQKSFKFSCPMTILTSRNSTYP